jgi:N-acetylglucosamine kinase-like BadF-type ATPase
MSKKYYLAADGGGSKLITLLYDDEFDVISTAKTDGTNILFKPVELVHSNIDKMLDELIPDYVNELEGADYCIVGSDGYFDEAVKRKISVKRMTAQNEGKIGLAAAFVKDGVLAISGTGSSVVCMINGRFLGCSGGWGPLLGDEGSGYDIGMRSIKAAIYSYEGRRSSTMMTQMIMDRFNISNLYDIIFLLNKDPDVRHVIASIAKITSKAAAEGDRVAVDIYKHAAKEMYRTTKSIINKIGGIPDVPIVVMGGAWKGSDVMFKTYSDLINAKYPNAQTMLPVFEPVVGCIICKYFSEGAEPEDVRNMLSGKFEEFRIKWGNI